MANPIYKFTLSANGGTEQQAFPVYKDDLSLNYEHPSGQEFFQRKLNGKLTFIKTDYTFITSQVFDAQFGLKIYISYNAGSSWTLYWTGKFFKTNCEFSDDDQTCVVTPDVDDLYSIVMAGLDHEYDLIQLKPVIDQVKLDKRPLVQVYIPGKEVVGCFLSNMWWEQECEAVQENETIEGGYNKLEYYYHFTFNKAVREVFIDGSPSPSIPKFYWGTRQTNIGTAYAYSNGGYTFQYTWTLQSQYVQVDWEIKRNSDSVVLWRYRYTGQNPPVNPAQITMQPVDGTGASGTLAVTFVDVPVYCRLVCDTDTISGDLSTYNIPSDDFVWNNRNYKKCIGYYFPDTIGFTDSLTSTPTEWGIYQPGQYYQTPYAYWHPEWFPICRAVWNQVSVWYTATAFDWIVEESARKEYTLKHAYPLYSVISVLLGQIAPTVSHSNTTTYSRFLYGSNPISGITQYLFITPKSNLVSSGYDQPAQKAPITLKRVLDMLRDCFRCYWFIDDSNRFRIEHISYFMNGGAYSGSPVVGRDLTAEQVTRNGKKWAFDTSKYSFDKPEMAARYQFGWMDDVTKYFDGLPMDIVSKYVNPDNTEQIDISQFSSDVDYILLNPSEISKDGFVLMAATLQSGSYKLPYYNFVFEYSDHYLQNAYAAFVYLQQYYFYDMPARYFTYNGAQTSAYGIKKLKTQSLKFPMLNDPNTLQLIKTNLGNGTIQKVSINLSNRTAQTTLKYVTE